MKPGQVLPCDSRARPAAAGIATCRQHRSSGKLWQVACPQATSLSRSMHRSKRLQRMGRAAVA